MRKNKSITKLLALSLSIVLGLGVLQGCGTEKTQEDILAGMKEFVTPDGSASIYLDQDWEEEDLGVSQYDIDYWMGAVSPKNDEIAILMQFPRQSAQKLASTMDEVKELVESNYSISGEEEVTELPEVPGMTNIEVVKGRISNMGVSCDAYIIYGETDYAYYCLLYGANNMDDEMIATIKASCSQFKETAPEEEDATTAEVTDTIRWFNASYAVLTQINGWDYNRFGGVAANEENAEVEKELLKEWWDVTDRATADETLDWILTEGHRTQFAEDMANIEAAGIGSAKDRTAFMLENYQVDEEQAKYYADMYGLYEQYGATAIDGWDYCRALNLLGYYYLAGYYTETEALDKSLEIAQTAQPLFDSWDSMIESYLRGYEYWSEESADERRAVYEELKAKDDNPYAVDYNTELEKTW